VTTYERHSPGDLVRVCVGTTNWSPAGKTVSLLEGDIVRVERKGKSMGWPDAVWVKRFRDDREFWVGALVGEEVGETEAALEALAGVDGVEEET